MIPSSQFVARISANQLPNIEETNQLRVSAAALRSKVSKGAYDEDDLKVFWELVQTAGIVLRASNPEISERSGLGSEYFSSVARDRRRPKLVNMLKSLTGIVEIANERLADVERTNTSVEFLVGWISNPLRNDSKLADKLQADLVQLIEQLKASNSLSEIKEIDEHYKKSLIDLLETTISLLKAPLIERSLITDTGEILKKLAEKIGDHASAGFIGGLAGAAAAALLKLI